MRGFELVTDIAGSWNKDKTMNCFMVKQSPFAQTLAVSSIRGHLFLSLIFTRISEYSNKYTHTCRRG